MNTPPHTLTALEAETLVADFQRFGWTDAELMANFDAIRDQRNAAYWASPHLESEQAARAAERNADAVRWALHLRHCKTI